MVVRSKMSPTEIATKNRMETILVSEPVPIECVQGGVESVRKRIESGKAFLRVVAYPWGIEFDVCEVGDER